MTDDTQVEWVPAADLQIGDVVVFDGIRRTVDQLIEAGPCLRVIPGEPERVCLAGRVLRVTDEGGLA